ncbi:hypothetical protein [Frankia sp. QA3]|uniref:hypothetical protein n=1 Tax=Frankia sp. QA3 TaxID=710111 RepID=UPI000269CDEE|nr:hypothetical protein [Frankia sp. QA3]EIV96158.1 hypothetical protein FraQA3DRAFT_6025 [Frankia sp. QA3]
MLAPLTDGPPPAGYSREGALGSVYRTNGVPGTRPLYSCLIGADSFPSLLADCEGRQVVGVLGWVYGARPATPATAVLYRCHTGQNDHFASRDPACEGRIVEGTQGHLIIG